MTTLSCRSFVAYFPCPQPMTATRSSRKWTACVPPRRCCLSWWSSSYLTSFSPSTPFRLFSASPRTHSLCTPPTCLQLLCVAFRFLRGSCLALTSASGKQALRSLFPLVAGAMGELKYLDKAVSLVLGFIGAKMVADVAFDVHVSTSVSLAVVVGALSAGVGLSLALSDADTPEEP